MKIVSGRALLKGSWFALEQCGLLLQHAKILHQATAYPTAVALSLIAREELGRHYILLDLWRQAADGKEFSVEKVKKRCEDHMARQRQGQRSVVLRGDPNVRRLVETFQAHGIESQEAREAEAKVQESSERRGKRVPDERHHARMSAIYVDLKPSGDWNRPSEIGKDDSANALQDAANDYSGTRMNLIAAIAHQQDPQLASAVEAWPDRPDLPLPSWPD